MREFLVSSFWFLEAGGAERTERSSVIVRQCAHCRGNPFLFSFEFCDLRRRGMLELLVSSF